MATWVASSRSAATSASIDPSLPMTSAPVDSPVSQLSASTQATIAEVNEGRPRRSSPYHLETWRSLKVVDAGQRVQGSRLASAGGGVVAALRAALADPRAAGDGPRGNRGMTVRLQILYELLTSLSRR